MKWLDYCSERLRLASMLSIARHRGDRAVVDALQVALNDLGRFEEHSSRFDSKYL